MTAVSDVMTREVHTVSPEAHLKDVARVLSAQAIGGVAVVDGRDRPLGVITTGDILVARSGGAPRRSRPGRRRSGRNVAGAKTAADVMSAPAITIEPARPVAAAGSLMAECCVSRLPVVAHEVLVGMITRHDLLRVFTRADAELAEEIRLTVLGNLNWPDALALAIDQGEVVISGPVDSLDDARTLPRRVRDVIGVVSVDAELTAWDGFRDGPAVVKRQI